jgi:hypothetical protein
VNDFFDLVNKAVGTHRPGTDDRCSCGQPDDNFPWSEHVTQEIVDTLTDNLGLGHEMAPCANNADVILSRFATSGAPTRATTISNHATSVALSKWHVQADPNARTGSLHG